MGILSFQLLLCRDLMFLMRQDDFLFLSLSALTLPLNLIFRRPENDSSSLYGDHDDSMMKKQPAIYKLVRLLPLRRKVMGGFRSEPSGNNRKGSVMVSGACISF